MEQVMLDMIPTGAKAVCHASQGDIGRSIRFNLMSGGSAYTLAGTETIKVYIHKPDGTTAERNIANTSSTYVDWVTGDGDCDVSGKCECELVITSGTTIIGSKNFTMKVEEDPYNGQGVVIETAGPAPVATFDTNIIDLFVEIKCEINAIQEGTPWIDSNVIEKEPYNFRKVAGTASRIGNHLFDKLVGGTVAWNQLVVNGNFVDTSNWSYANATASASNNENTITASVETGQYNTAQRIAFNATHKYCLTFDLFSHNATWVDCSFSYKSKVRTTTNEQWLKMATICDGSLSGETSIFIITVNGSSTGSYIKLKNVMVIDLTAMFGSTIADYIYSLEQATAGSGVNFFRKLFPNSYYAYDAGSLKSVKTTAHKMVGKNLTDISDKTISGADYVIGGFPVAINTDNIVLPSGSYVFSFDVQNATLPCACQLIWYRNGVEVGNTVATINASGINSIPFTASGEFDSFVMFCNSSSGGAFTNFNLNIGSTPSAYEPYSAHNYALDDVELRGLFKLDANNKLYADGDTYESSGDVGRRFTLVDMGTLNWGKDGSNLMSVKIDDAVGVTGGVLGNYLCGRYTPSTAWRIYGSDDDKIFYVSSDHYVRVKDSAYASASGSDFKTAMSGVYLLYEKEIPTTEQADPYTNPQQVDANGTEEYVDSRSVAIPVGHETYYADIYDITGFTSCKISVADGQGIERKSATIQFGQTVYDGILEYKNGAWQFVGTKELVTYDGSDDELWIMHGSGSASAFAMRSNVVGLNIDIDATPNANYLEGISRNATWGNYDNWVSVTGGGQIVTGIQSITDVSTWKTYLSNNPLQVKYKLATPFTLALTGAQLETLLGENRVSHNCNGDTEVKYLYNA